jgi:hypothetical protein
LLYAKKSVLVALVSEASTPPLQSPCGLGLALAILYRVHVGLGLVSIQFDRSVV